jgi:hypothetical protein
MNACEQHVHDDLYLNALDCADDGAVKERRKDD